MPSNADLGWAGQRWTPAVPQDRCLSHLLVVVLPHPAPVACYTGTFRALCVLWTDLLDMSSSFLLVFAAEVGQKIEAGNPPLSSTISNSSYRPEAWGLNGGGEKRLNEQSEISAAASSHMSTHSSDWTTPLFKLLPLPLYFSICLPVHTIFCAEEEWN